MNRLTYSNWIIIITLLFGCNERRIESDADQPSTPVEQEVKKAVIAETDKKKQSISVTGYIDVPPENRVSISPYFGGYAKKIRVLPGQSVKKGEMLFTLENPEYLKVQQDYLESKEQLDYLKANYDRQKQLADEQIASTKNFKKAESDYKVMLARYRALTEQLKLMGLTLADLEGGELSSAISITAPIAGNITAVNINKGEFADAKEAAVELVNLDHIHLELELFEKDALQVKEGQRIQFTIPETGSQKYEGKVHLVGKSIDLKKRTVMVHGHIDEEINGLIPGMFVEASIVVE